MYIDCVLWDDIVYKVLLYPEKKDEGCGTLSPKTTHDPRGTEMAGRVPESKLV